MYKKEYIKQNIKKGTFTCPFFYAESKAIIRQQLEP